MTTLFTPDLFYKATTEGCEPSVVIRISGPVTIECANASRWQLSSAQAQVALVRLIIERREGTSRDQLADTLWPYGLPDTWASALRSVVSRVRAFLAPALPIGATPLVAQDGQYRLNLPDYTAIDLEYAETAIADARAAMATGRFPVAWTLASTAATCLQSPLLPNHDGEWVAGVRQRVADIHVTALETASMAASAMGRCGDALSFANEAIRLAPLRESAHRCRMSAHVTSGNRGEALRAYSLLRRSLSEELGVDPAPETEAAYLELLGAPSSAPESADVGDAVVAGSPAPFVGREPELAVLAEARRRARGTGHMVLVTGERGIGKTRLVTEAARRVTLDGGLVLCGRCDRSSALPCQPFVEALGGYVAATPDDSLPELSQATRDELAGLFSEDLSPAGLQSSKEALMVALTELTVGVARSRPLLVLLDDLHEADADTLLLLRRLSRRGAGTCLLILATANDSGGSGGPFADVAHDLDRDGWLSRLVLTGLEETDIRALVRQMLPDVPPDCRPPPYKLIADTAGNVLLMLEIVRSYRDDGKTPRLEPGPVPAGVQNYAAARLAALDASQQRLLFVAAVVGGPFELDLTAKAAAIKPDAALDVLDSLLATGLVAELNSAQHGQLLHTYCFTHDILRRALCERLSDARHRSIHVRLADAIELLRPDDLGQYALALAHHRAGGAAPWGDRRAVHWGWLAAARATEGRAPDEAVRLYRRALDHVPAKDHILRAEALTNLGLAQLHAGQAGSEQALLDGAIQACRYGRMDIAAHAALGLADVVAFRSALRGEAAALIEDVLGKATSNHFARPTRQGEPGPIDDLTLARLIARHVQLGGQVTSGTATIAAALNAFCVGLRELEGPDHLERRLAMAGDLLIVATAAKITKYRIVATHHLAMATSIAGECATRDVALTALAAAVSEASRITEEASRITEEDKDSRIGDALLAEHAISVAATQGRFTDAGKATRLVAAVTDDDANWIGQAPGSMAVRQMMVAGWLQGSSWPSQDGRIASPHDAAERSLRSLVEGDHGRAHLTVRALATGVDQLPSGDEWPHVVGLLGLVAVEIGDPTTADAVRNMLTPYADINCSVGYRSYVAPASFHLGRLAAVAGDWAEAERHLTAALRVLAERGARPWIALTQHALAGTLEARGRPGDRRWVAALRAEAHWSATRLGLNPRYRGARSVPDHG